MGPKTGHKAAVSSVLSTASVTSSRDGRFLLWRNFLSPKKISLRSGTGNLHKDIERAPQISWSGTPSQQTGGVAL